LSFTSRVIGRNPILTAYENPEAVSTFTDKLSFRFFLMLINSDQETVAGLFRINGMNVANLS